VDEAAFICSGVREIEIADGNDAFRVSGDLLLRSSDEALIYYIGFSPIVEIPCEVEVISEDAFYEQTYFSSVTFGSDSQLRQIKAKAFSHCDSLDSISLPSLVSTIDGDAFEDSGICDIRIAEGNRHFRVLGDFLLSFDGKSPILYFGVNPIVEVPRDIEVIMPKAFALCKELCAVEFESGSQLQQISQKGFSGCRLLTSICFPSLVRSIHWGAFDRSGICEIQIAEDTRHFRVSGDFLLSWDGTSLIH
jgi:hypothetical protein